MWVGLIEFAPKDFDYVDTYTENDLYDLDKTCSWTYGIPLQGLPNQCGIKVKERSGSGPGGCVQPPMPDPLNCTNGAGKWMWDADACEWWCQEPAS